MDSAPWVWAQNVKGKLEKRSLTLGDYDAEMDTYVVTDGLTADDSAVYKRQALFIQIHGDIVRAVFLKFA